MRWTVPCLWAVLLATSALAADSQGNLTVVLTGFRNDAGAAMVSVFQSPDGFPYETDKAVAKAKVAIKNGRAVAVFPGLAYGTYAVAAFHDQDLSGKLERNFVGIPKKGYGLSNSPPGLPGFAKSKFNLESPDQTVSIPISY
jgi:uncharacterized protein (DUF2141 family)